MEIEPSTSQSVLEELDPKQSRMISRVLSPAIRLWLRSQLEQVEALHFTIEAGDRQLLAGNIQRVVVSARKAVYRGLHLSQAQITGHNIRTNFGQVVRGKPLRLLAAFPITGQVVLQAADVSASLTAPLLGNAVIDFLLSLLQTKAMVNHQAGDSLRDAHLQNPQVSLEAGELQFSAILATSGGFLTPVRIQTCLMVENGNQLRLHNLRWLLGNEPDHEHSLHPLEDVTFDLGPNVALTELTLESGQIRCQGQIMVTPEAE